MRRHSLLLFIFLLIARVSYGQDLICYGKIYDFDLKKRIITAQKLQILPEIIDTLTIRNESSIQDTIILLLIEKRQATPNEFICVTRTSDLTKFYEIIYSKACEPEGQIDIGLSIHSFDQSTGIVTVYCEDRLYYKLTILE